MKLIFVLLLITSSYAQDFMFGNKGKKAETCPYLLGDNNEDEKKLISGASDELNKLSMMAKKCSPELSQGLQQTANNFRGMMNNPILNDPMGMGDMDLFMGTKQPTCDNFDLRYKQDFNIAEAMINEGVNSLSLIPADYQSCSNKIQDDGGMFPPPEIEEITPEMIAKFNECAVEKFSSLMIKKKIECRGKRDEDKIKAKRDGYLSLINTASEQIISSINMVADNPECKGLNGGAIAKMMNIGQGLSGVVKNYVSITNPLAGAGLGLASGILSAGVNYFQKRNGINQMLSELEGIREYNIAQCQMLKLNESVFSCKQRADEEYVKRNMIELCSDNSTDEDFIPINQMQNATRDMNNIYSEIEPFKQAVRDAKTEEEKKLAEERMEDKAKDIREKSLEGADAFVSALGSEVKQLDADGKIIARPYSQVIKDSIMGISELMKDSKNPNWIKFRKNPENHALLRSLKDKVERLAPMLKEYENYSNYINEFDWMGGDYDELDAKRVAFVDKLIPVSKNAISDLGIIDDFSYLKEQIQGSEDSLSNRILQSQLKNERKRMIGARFRNASMPELNHNAREIDLAHTALVNGLRPLHLNRLEKDFEVLKKNMASTGSVADRASEFDKYALPLFKECVLGMTGSWLGGDQDTRSSNSISSPSKKSQWSKSCGFLFTDSCVKQFRPSKNCQSSADNVPCVNNEFKSYYCEQKDRFGAMVNQARGSFLKTGKLCGNSLDTVKKGIAVNSGSLLSPLNVGTEFSSKLKEDNMCPELTSDVLGNRLCATALPGSVYENSQDNNIQKINYPKGVIFRGNLYGSDGYFFTNGSSVKFIDAKNIKGRSSSVNLNVDGNVYSLNIKKERSGKLKISPEKDKFLGYKNKQDNEFKNVFDKNIAHDQLGPYLKNALSNFDKKVSKENKIEAIQSLITCSVNADEALGEIASKYLEKLETNEEKAVRGKNVVQ